MLRMQARTEGEVMRAKPEHFPLSAAFLCTDCDCIGSTPEHCAGCGSVAILKLAPILNREERSKLEARKMWAELERRLT